jgi:hypothetical protein
MQNKNSLYYFKFHCIQKEMLNFCVTLSKIEKVETQNRKIKECKNKEI